MRNVVRVFVITFVVFVMASCSSTPSKPMVIAQKFADAVAKGDVGTAKDNCTVKTSIYLDLLYTINGVRPNNSFHVTFFRDSQCGDVAYAYYRRGEDVHSLKLVMEDKDWKVELNNGSSESSEALASDYNDVVYKNGTQAVDLGLSVLWADRNVGAISIDDPGHLYSWGNSNWSDTNNKNKKIPSFKNISNTSYDIAKNELGDGWRMPSVKELKELKDNCYWKLIREDAGSYFELTSKINGNKIRLYLAGFSHFINGDTKNLNKTGHIWSSEKYNKDQARNLSFVNNGKCSIESYYSKGGVSVRAVRER